MASASAAMRFDSLLSDGSINEAVALLRTPEGAEVELSSTRTAALIDAAASLSEEAAQAAADKGAEEARSSDQEALETLQATLLDCYSVLTDRGALRGFGSIAGWPAPQQQCTTQEQLALTGLPTSAFAPAGDSGSLYWGAASAALVAIFSAAIGQDYRLVGGVIAAILLADRIGLGGVGFEVLVRLVRPTYQRTVLQHEAGHFLIAYLLGWPIEACLLDPVRAARDPRFPGAAGTVFFDPSLAAAMRGGELKRGELDRYSVVVMAGIAAEAEANGRAEGGRSDEEALIRLLTSLDQGRSWDLAKIQNQARWAASNAVLILRQHAACYTQLCKLLEQGASVGNCVLAIEAALSDCVIPPPPTPPTAAPAPSNAPVKEVLRLDSPEFAIRMQQTQEREVELETQLAEVNERLKRLQETESKME